MEDNSLERKTFELKKKILSDFKKIEGEMI